MSKTRDNSPELDYFELRRRHEEYKRARNAPQPEKISVEERLERQVAQRKAKPEPIAAEETPINDVQDTPDVEIKAAPVDAFEEAIEENYEAYADDMDDDSDDDAVNPNPFDSFIRFFNGVKSNMSARRHKDDELEDLELDDLTDEELAELEAEEADNTADTDFYEDEATPAPAKRRFSLRRSVQPDEDYEDDELEEIDPIEDVKDIKDIESAPRSARKKASDFIDEDEDDSDSDNSDFDDEDFDDSDFEGLDDDDFDDEDDEDEEYEDDEDRPHKNGFKKFVNLFVTRIDEDEADDEDDYEDEEFEEIDDELEEIDIIDEDEDEAPVRKGFFSRNRKNKAHRVEADDEIYDDFDSEIQLKSEGGQVKMDEMNKPVSENAVQTEAFETSGMSRRERRERAMRLAAEEAARKAEEEARAKAASQSVEPLFNDLEEKHSDVDMAAFEDAPKSNLIVETTAHETMETVDEPTREFTPVSMRDVQEAAEKALFDVDNDEDYDGEDDEDDDDEIVEKKPRRSLFGRKRAHDDEDDFDDEDEDDEDYDDEDEDDDDDEIIEKKPRRGLFGRKRARDDEDDDEDDFDDEDDEDYDDEDDDYDDDDDEYDEYDDDDEDEYDDDDDEYDDDDAPHRSFGHHLIGVFKIILALILVLLILVIGMNFHYYVTGKNAVVTTVHDMLGDSSASDVLCFGYVMREAMPVEDESASEVLPEVEATAEPTVSEQTDTIIPDLNSNGTITESPVVESAPVIDAAPAIETAPAVVESSVASGSVG